MIHGLAAAIAVLLRFACNSCTPPFCLSLWNLLSDKRRASAVGKETSSQRTGRHEQRRLGEMGCRRGESMPLLGGDPAPCFCKYLSFEDYSLYPGSAILCTADNRICEENKK